jgi:hypothetical protein
MTTQPKSQKTKVKVTIKYRIYSVDEKGMLNRPLHSGYGGNDYPKYDDSNSIEEAARLIEEAGDYSEYIILPVTNSSIG